MKNMYVATANVLIDFPKGAKAYISLIGVFDTEENAKQGIEAYSYHQVADEHKGDQHELAEGIAEICQINKIELNAMYPDLELEYESY